MSYQYKKIKLSDGSTIDEHRLVWIQNYGDIPEGMVVHHVNGDKMDNRIENLELMENRAHSRMHAETGVHHGTEQAYKKYRCRCDVCVQEQRARRRRYYEGHVAKTVGVETKRHGTIAGYVVDRCRCSECRRANREREAHRREKLG